MNVKGFTVLGAKKGIIYRFGEERWNDFFERFKESNPEFPDSILPTSKIPAESYLALEDALIKEFYKSDTKKFWRSGEIGAKVMLKEGGPFHVYVKHKRNPKDFIANVLPRVWKMYYDEGSAKYELEGNIAHFYILDLPIYHIFFEYSTMGWIKKALEITGVSVKEIIKVKGTAKEIYYKFVLDL